MQIAWLDREPGHWKLVVEPLNVLLTLRQTDKTYYEAECLGQSRKFRVVPTLEGAKMLSLLWFNEILCELQLQTRGLINHA